METIKAVQINTIKLLRDVKWANSNSEARRMLQSNGLRIDGEQHTQEEFYFAGSSFIMQYGRRLFMRVRIPAMEEYYDHNSN